MLVLTRKAGERVILTRHGEKLGEVMVTQLLCGSVRLGFEMDRHVQVLRTEVTEKYPPGTQH